MASSSSRKSASSASNESKGSARDKTAKPRKRAARIGRGGRRTPTVTRSTTESGSEVASVRLGDLPKDDESKRSARKTSSSSRSTRTSTATGSARSSRSSRSTSSRSTAGSTTGKRRGRSRASLKNDERLKPKRNYKRWVILGVIVALILGLVAGFIALYNSSVFTIEDVQVRGADHLTADEIDHLVTVPEDATLLTVDTDAIVRSLERDAWVESVNITREFPSTLGVNVTERPVGAIVEVPVGTAQTIQQWAISKDGMWLMAIPSQDSTIGQNLSPRIYEDVENSMHIIDVGVDVRPEIGAYCTDESILNALSIVSGMSTNLADQVKIVSATDSDSTMLTLDNGIEIAFGKAESIRDKERACLEIIEKVGEGRIAYINVRVPDRPTYRAA